MAKIREEIEWVEKNGILFTTLIMWNHLYQPHQVVIFRKLIENHLILIKYYLNISSHIYHHIGLIESKNYTEEETLFHITFMIKHKLDNKEDEKIEENDFDDEFKDAESILNDVFLDEYVMHGYQLSSPDFGFYSLSTNFHILKKMILENQKPTLEEEVRRLMSKYNQSK